MLSLAPPFIMSSERQGQEVNRGLRETLFRLGTQCLAPPNRSYRVYLRNVETGERLLLYQEFYHLQRV